MNSYNIFTKNADHESPGSRVLVQEHTVRRMNNADVSQTVSNRATNIFRLFLEIQTPRKSQQWSICSTHLLVRRQCLDRIGRWVRQVIHIGFVKISPQFSSSNKEFIFGSIVSTKSSPLAGSMVGQLRPAMKNSITLVKAMMLYDKDIIKYSAVFGTR